MLNQERMGIMTEYQVRKNTEKDTADLMSIEHREGIYPSP